MAENRLNYIFDGDNSGFQQALRGVQDKLKEVGNQMKEFGSTMSTYVSLPLAALGGAAIKAFGDIQALKNGLTAITGSAEEANTQFVRLKELAKLPGLGLKEVTKGSISLQVIGFSAEKAEKSIKAFGNAVALVGGGTDEFKRATYGLAQLANTDFPLGEDLNIIKDAIPQVTPLLKEAFGTARSDELKALGISSGKVVDAIVGGLSKLPPVTGGINNAFENLKDGVFQSLSEIGEIIDNNLDISALSDKIVSALSNVTEWFKNLSPEIQQATLVFAGLAIVIPPIIAALGVFISTILPALAAGFAALTSPITLVVVAIATAAYAIYENWNAIKEYFTKGDGSSFFSAIVKYASDLWDSLKSIFNSIKTFVIGVWNAIGTNIIGYVKGAFGIIQGVISTVLGVISGYVKIFASVIKGDWSGVWEGIKDIAIALWNGILQVIKGGINQVSNALAGFFKLIGMKGLAVGIEAANKKISSVFTGLQVPVKKATEAVKDFNKEVAKSSTVKPKTEVKSTSGSKGDSKEITDVYKDLAIKLKQIDVDFGKTFDEKEANRIKAYQDAINDLIKNGVDPLSNSIKKLQDLQQNNNLLQLPKGFSNEIRDKKDKTPVAKTQLGKLAVLVIDEKAKKFALAIEDLNQSIAGSMKGAVSSMVEGFADMVGAMASGSMSMGDVAKSLIGILADMAVQVGKTAIATGVAMLGIKAAFSNPITAIAAGVALVALGSAMKGQLTKAGVNSGSSSSGGGKKTAFANGGIVSSPTNAIFGEYPSAGRGNPEVVAPLNSLKGMLGDIGGSGGGQVVFEIQADRLVGVLSNYNKRQFRTS